MVIYECDMCGKTFPNEGYVQQITARVNHEETPFDEGLKTFDVCRECSCLIGEFISSHKSRMKGLRCVIDSPFSEKEKQ